MPKPLFGSKRWDKKAIDDMLDKASGLALPTRVDNEDPYERWLRESNDVSPSGGELKLDEWTDRELATPLGKREKIFLQYLYEHPDLPLGDLAFPPGTGHAAFTKLGARGYLVPLNDYWYRLELTPAGIEAWEKLAAHATG